MDFLMTPPETVTEKPRVSVSSENHAFGFGNHNNTSFMTRY